MVKLLAILLMSLIFEAIGVVLLSQGLKQIGEIQQLRVAEVVRVIKSGAANPRIVIGIAFEAVFFGCLLILMSRGDVSFVWPLTALGFILTTLAAKIWLREEVSMIRWSGVILIMAGAALVSYSEKVKTRPTPSVPAKAESALAKK